MLPRTTSLVGSLIETTVAAAPTTKSPFKISTVSATLRLDLSMSLFRVKIEPLIFSMSYVELVL